MHNRMFINTRPGTTFLDKLTGKTKVRTFLALIIFLVSTWDIRIILPLFVLFCIGLVSLKPDYKRMKAAFMFMVIINLFNIFLMWLVEPDYGAKIVGSSHILFRFNHFYVISQETLWYFFVRFMKFIATFAVSLVFIQSITPSEMAAGLYSLHIPYKICTIVSIAFRYIPDITRDYLAIKVSMQARGLELDSKKTKLSTRLKQNVLILAPLLISSFDRVGNIANAMDLRGFGKRKTKTYYAEHEDTKGDKYMQVFYIFILILCVALVIKSIVYPSPFQVWSPWQHTL